MIQERLSSQSVQVFAAAATAPTALAAFDRTLQVGNVHDVNLVTLSSVIPPGTGVVRDHCEPGDLTVGDRLYCVRAVESAVEPGEQAWAGLAWALDRHARGGVFVEAHGHAEQQVRYELQQSLMTLMADRSYWDFGAPDDEVVGITCKRDPVCALVMGIYQARSWQGGA